MRVLALGLVIGCAITLYPLPCAADQIYLHATFEVRLGQLARGPLLDRSDPCHRLAAACGRGAHELGRNPRPLPLDQPDRT